MRLQTSGDSASHSGAKATRRLCHASRVFGFFLFLSMVDAVTGAEPRAGCAGVLLPLDAGRMTIGALTTLVAYTELCQLSIRDYGSSPSRTHLPHSCDETARGGADGDGVAVRGRTTMDASADVFFCTQAIFRVRAFRAIDGLTRLLSAVVLFVSGVVLADAFFFLSARSVFFF